MDILWIVIAAFVGNLLDQIQLVLQQNGSFSSKTFGAGFIAAIIVGVAFGLSYQFITPGVLTAIDILAAVMGGYIASTTTTKVLLARAANKK